MNSTTRRRNVPLLLLLLAGLVLLAGCGGGGGGGGSSSGPQIVTITGFVKDAATGHVLPTRTVTVQGTNLSGQTKDLGDFSIAGVTVGSITLVITDSNGIVNGTFPVDLSKLSGNPRAVGTISLNVSGGGGTITPPPPPPI